MRYSHYLRRPTRVWWPRRVYCLTESWCTHLELGESSYHVVGSCRLPDNLSAVLARAAMYGGQSWILSYHCARIWDHIGLWEGIEDGTYRLSRRDAARPTDGVGTVLGMRGKDTRKGPTPLRTVLSGLSEPIQALCVTEDPPNILRFRVGTGAGEIVWLDVRNYGVEPVDDGLGDAGLCDQMAWWWISYHHLARQLDLGSAAMTYSSAAMHAYRRTYMPPGIYAHADKDALALEEASYIGGRAECFRIGVIDDHVTHYDVRSMYGHVMATTVLPVRLSSVHVWPESDWILRSTQGLCCIADVDISTDEPAYPCRYMSDTIWPVGSFRAVLAGPELSDAVCRSRVTRCHALATYHMDMACKTYADTLYAARREYADIGNGMMEAYCKRLLVGLSGKLGQRDRTWEVVPDSGNAPLYGEWHGVDAAGHECTYKSIGGTVLRSCTHGYSPDSIPAMASWITSAGRMYLLNLIRTAGWDNVYYADTDSIVTTGAGCQGLALNGYTVGPYMGQLHVVYEGSGMRIYGIKHYRTGDRTVFAGLPRGAITDCGDGTHYLYQQSPSSAIYKGNRPNGTVKLLRYPTAQAYRHGVVSPNGWVRPIELDCPGGEK